MRNNTISGHYMACILHFFPIHCLQGVHLIFSSLSTCGGSLASVPCSIDCAQTNADYALFVTHIASSCRTVYSNAEQWRCEQITASNSP
ncbi:hypothetical protein GDO78_022823 [Eleutherodactylus coqui]|uniref:Uncharacterized protein n=1 Tax=Eleutherodactylus coqui TaxID=57060 RepID=A0A8J6E9E8_ELECQ|nr:hypothetical protein GDO78_022823 [Eleutherodactylus coqui]